MADVSMGDAVAGDVVESGVSAGTALTLTAITGLPEVQPGNDLGALLCSALRSQQIELHACDVLVVTSKVVAKAENRYVDLATVVPSERAISLAAEVGKDPRLVEVVLWDTEAISRKPKGALIVRHRTGHVSANAGIDQSNLRPAHATQASGPWVLRLPEDADTSAEHLRACLHASFGVAVGVIISDSFGRPFRQGTIGQAIGVAGFPAIFDQRGRRDLHGRILETTITSPADQLAAVSDLVAGQADEARPAVHVRGLRFRPDTSNGRSICRPIDGDLYL